MKYMLLIQNNYDAWDALGKDVIDKIMEAHGAVQDELRSAGEFVEARELNEESKVVRTNGGVPAVTDGPFIETKEVLAGYYIVDCVDLERAVEIAGRFGEAEHWPIEVRQIA